MKKIFTIILTAILLLSLQNTSFTSLKDFKSDVENDERSSGGSSGGGGGSSSDYSSDSSSGDDCGEVLFYLWFYANLNVRYLDYPYVENEYNKNFIIVPPGFFKDTAEKDMYDQDGKLKNEFSGYREEKDFYYRGNVYYLKTEAGLLYAFDNGMGYYASLRGKFIKIIGPEFETRMLDDGEDRLFYHAAGGNIAMVQYGGFMMDAYLQAAYMRGILSRNGAAGGVLMTIYPVKPFTISLKAGFQDYGKITFSDFEGKLGYITGRIELNLGCRIIKSETASISSFSGGVIFHI